MAEPDRPPDEVAFEQSVDEALDSLPPELAALMSNVAVVVEEEPPAGAPLLGLYQGAADPSRERLRSGSARQDHDLPPSARAAVRRRPRAATTRDSSRRAPRGRAPLRDQRRAARRARPLLSALWAEALCPRP